MGVQGNVPERPRRVGAAPGQALCEALGRAELEALPAFLRRAVNEEFAGQAGRMLRDVKGGPSKGSNRTSTICTVAHDIARSDMHFGALDKAKVMATMTVGKLHRECRGGAGLLC